MPHEASIGSPRRYCNWRVMHSPPGPPPPNPPSTAHPHQYPISGKCADKRVCAIIRIASFGGGQCPSQFGGPAWRSLLWPTSPSVTQGPDHHHYNVYTCTISLRLNLHLSVGVVVMPQYTQIKSFQFNLS